MIYTKEKLEELAHRWTTPTGKRLIKTIKESRCYLSPVLFREKVHHFSGINDEELGDGIDLRGAPLNGFDFRSSIQEDDGYSEKIAILSNIHFEGASIKHCNFQDGKIYDCHFENADLSHSDFNGSDLNNCIFHSTNTTGVNLRGAKLINCDFTDANIKDIGLDSTIIDEKTTFGKSLKSEKEQNFHFASIEYKQIKEMYKNSSLHSIADHYHYKEMVAKRKITALKNPLRWLNYFFGDILCKYGTSYLHVMLWSIIVIILCATTYTAHEGITYQDTPIIPSFADSFYFSMITFTTVGYGDYHPTGVIRFLAAFEGFMGAALMALFTVIVARNIIRD